MKPSRWITVDNEPQIIESAPISKNTWQVKRGRNADIEPLLLRLSIVAISLLIFGWIYFGNVGEWAMVLLMIPSWSAYRLINHNNSRTITLFATGIKIVDGYRRSKCNEFHLVSPPFETEIFATELDGGKIKLRAKSAGGHWFEVANGSHSEMTELQDWIGNHFTGIGKPTQLDHN